MKDTLTVVLGGGAGSRLWPLTAQRAKPAVSLAGKYRLIDVPISNAINSGLRRIYVLTQFNSASLNSHLAKTFRFDRFSNGWVNVLAAEQTEQSGEWYQGTADAVRQQLHQFQRPGIRDVLILSGDHLYRMDYRDLIARHRGSGADVTVSCIPVSREECSGFGVMAVDRDGMLVKFTEKPADDEDISAFATPEQVRWHAGMGNKPYLASMGVYVFRLDALQKLLGSSTDNDFGKHVLPAAIHTHRVATYVFHGYWEDIGTIEAFYQANLALCDENPKFRFFDQQAPIYTRNRTLPPSHFVDAKMIQSIVADGCEIHGARVEHSVIGLRATLHERSKVVDSIVMGADFYESQERRTQLAALGEIPVGIGAGTSVRRAIIDKNARIGPNCVIHGSVKRADEEHDGWVMREGIIIVKKNATIPPGSKL